MKTLHYALEAGIARVTLNRPQVLNALNIELMGELLELLERAAEDERVRVVVLAGKGRGFCSGADLRGLRPASEAHAETHRGSPEAHDPGAWVVEAMNDYYNPAVRRLHSMPVSTVARIHGVVAGGGLGLALGCDIAIAAHSADFVCTFGRQTGIVPDMGASWQLPRRLGRARALGMALLGDRIGARQAADWGLIWAAVPDTELDSHVEEIAQLLRGASGEALARTRQIMDEATGRSLDAQLEAEVEAQRELIPRNMLPAAEAFLSKRDPEFER